VRGKRVLLQNTSHVEGDVYHQTLAIEQGAFFEGKSRRTDDPTAGIGRFEQPPASPNAA
jgi:cytoskeletal protein CcmA (bactofilin family)